MTSSSATPVVRCLDKTQPRNDQGALRLSERFVNIGNKPRRQLCFVLNTWEKISDFLGMVWCLGWMKAEL